MEPKNLTVFELFERQLRYIVPLFQRQYVWKKEEQWEPLWEDIQRKAEEVVEKGTFDPKQNRHFLGAIVLHDVHLIGFQVKSMTVVDGQQRVTTLQIIQFALRHYARIVNHSALAENLKILTENSLSTIKPAERFKVWPTNSDQPIYEDIFNCASPIVLSAKYPAKITKSGKLLEPQPQLVSAYLYFFNQLKEFAEEGLTNVDSKNPDHQSVIFPRLDAIYFALANLMHVVTINLDEKDNPQVIFESLNDRGVTLAPSDLIRNFVFLEASRQGVDAERLYRDYWFDYDKPAVNGSEGFWKQEESQGRKKYIRLDQFIYHYLTYQLGSDVLITRIYREFQRWWEDQKDRQIEFEMRKLQRFSRVFATFYGSEEKARLQIFYKRLRTLEVSTLYPLLLYLVGEKRSELYDELDGIAIDLESYLIRRKVCNLSTKNYNRHFLSLLTRLKAAPEVNRKVIQDMLCEPTGIAVRWPDNAEFRNAWLSQPAYDNNSSRAEMILRAIDHRMATVHREEYTLQAKLSIEHLLPQAWKDNPNYPLPDNYNMSREQAGAERLGLIHTFGNLTLLTQALNSSISNGPFPEKRKKIAKNSALQMNAYFQDGPETWGEGQVVERGKNLFEFALLEWPYPIKP